MESRIKKYDRTLSIRKNLDGSTEVEKKSKFNRSLTYKIVRFENTYLGGGLLVVERLKKMDSTRRDFFVGSNENNKRLRTSKSDDRMHREIANFIVNGQQFVG